MIQKNIHLFTFCAIALLYLMFPIKIHQWESYWYAAGLESLFHVTDIHHFFNVKLNENLDFDIFNPNHPLLHLLADHLAPLLTKLRTLLIIQYINIIFSLVGLWVSFQVSIKLGLDKFKTSLFILLLGTTNLYWYYSMSGEVYIAPSVMLICVFYFLISLENSLTENKKYLRELILIPIFYSLACSFHLLAFPFLLVIVISFFILSKRYDSFILKRALLYLFGIGIPWAIFIYGHLLISYVKITSWDEYWNSIFVLSSMEGSSTTSSDVNFARSFFFLISSKAFSFLHALIRTHNALTVFYKVSIAFLSIFSVSTLIKNRQKFVNVVLLSWITIFVILFTFIIKAPFNDYWLLILFPFIFAICFSLQQLGFTKTSFFIFPLIICQFYFNFYFDIYPKSKATDQDFSLLANYQNLFDKAEHIYFFFDYGNERFFNEFWYENYIKKNKNVSILNEKTFLEFSMKNPKSRPSNFIIISPYPELHSSMLPRRKFLNNRLSTYFIETTMNETGSLVFQEFQKRMQNNFQIKNFIIGSNESIKYEKKAQYPPFHEDQYNLNYNLLVQRFSISDRDDRTIKKLDIK